MCCDAALSAFSVIAVIQDHDVALINGDIEMKSGIKVVRGGCPCESVVDKESASSSKVTLRPHDFAPLFGNEMGDVFLLVTSPRVRESLNVENPEPAFKLIEYSWTGPESRAGLIEKFRELQQANNQGTVIWITDHEFEHYDPELIKGLKLGAISYFSGSFSISSLTQCLEIIKKTDYSHELELEEALLDHLDGAQRIIFRSGKYNTNAIFEHQEAEHWFSLHGPIGYGQQSVLPTGELSALTDESGGYSFYSRFNINGELVLKGLPVVHRGNKEITSDDTEKTFAVMSRMYDYPVVAKVKNGVIEDIYSPTPGENPFLKAMNKLFEDDERYRKIHEIGLGTNVLCAPFVLDNFFPNERYPGVHFGLGLGGYTSYHHDLVCSDTDILFEMEDGETVNLHRKLGLVS